MYLKKILAQPNVVGAVLIVVLVGAGFVYAFAFDGFNIETATGGDVEVWVAMASSGNCGGDDDESEPCECLYAPEPACGACPPLKKGEDKGECAGDSSNDSDSWASCSDNCPPRKAEEGSCSECTGDHECKNAVDNLCGSDNPKCTLAEEIPPGRGIGNE